VPAPGCASRWREIAISHKNRWFAVARLTRLFLLITSACLVGQTVSIIAPGRTLAAESSPVGQPTLPNLRIVQELRTPGRISAIVWSSDGAKLAAASLGSPEKIPTIPSTNIPSPFGNLITIWNSNGEVYRELQRPQAFFESHDTFTLLGRGTQLVVPPSMASNDVAFSVFEAETGNLLRDLPGSHPGLPRNVNGATLLLTTPDESILAVIFGRALKTFFWRSLPHQRGGVLMVGQSQSGIDGPRERRIVQHDGRKSRRPRCGASTPPRDPRHHRRSPAGRDNPARARPLCWSRETTTLVR
jgi:hypothetical protein